MLHSQLLSRSARALWATWPRRLAVVAAVALLLLLAWRATRGPEVQAWPAELRPLVQRVVATGQVRPPARVALASLVLGRVRSVAVREGDRVVSGQVLVKLDDDEPSAALRQAQGKVAEAAARLEQVRGPAGRVAAEALHQAELKAGQASQDAVRARALGEAGAISRQAREEAERALAVARSQRDGAAAQAAAAAGGADDRLALATLAQAEAARVGAAVRLDETEVRAPGKGLVVARDVEPGDVAPAGRALVSMVLDGDLELTAQIDEKNLALLAPGQHARASADAFPGQPFDAMVGLIAPAVDPLRGTVEVRFRVPAPPPVLRPDMTVSINVEVARKAASLVFPAEAIRGTAEEPWVLVVSGGRAERRAVTLGLRGDGLVEVVSGLTAGDVVVAPSTGPVAPGQRVRVRLLPLPGAGRAL